MRFQPTVHFIVLSVVAELRDNAHSMYHQKHLGQCLSTTSPHEFLHHQFLTSLEWLARINQFYVAVDFHIESYIANPPSLSCDPSKLRLFNVAGKSNEIRVSLLVDFSVPLPTTNLNHSSVANFPTFPTKTSNVFLATQTVSRLPQNQTKPDHKTPLLCTDKQQNKHPEFVVHLKMFHKR